MVDLHHIASDCHCAYNNGKAVHEILKTALLPEKEREGLSCKLAGYLLKSAGYHVYASGADENYGYTSSTGGRKKCWTGIVFAGCWFLPAWLMPLFADRKRRLYLASARKAGNLYRKYVKELNCYGTPMDTWKAVDEEGNLALVRGTRLLHEITEKEYLEDLESGACYEYLWRYGFRRGPEYAPVNSGWNACGGSVTSISNPHIHPDGGDRRWHFAIIRADQTGDEYHRSRADDSTAWLMQNLECYPGNPDATQRGVA